MADKKRLIDANALLRFAKYDARLVAPYKHTAGDILAMVKTAPTVDAVEVVHGRWLNSHTIAFTEECSQCGFCVPWDDDGMLHKYNYCPNCGADMRGDGNDI